MKNKNILFVCLTATLIVIPIYSMSQLSPAQNSTTRNSTDNTDRVRKNDINVRVQLTIPLDNNHITRTIENNSGDEEASTSMPLTNDSTDGLPPPSGGASGTYTIMQESDAAVDNGGFHIISEVASDPDGNWWFTLGPEVVAVGTYFSPAVSEEVGSFDCVSPLGGPAPGTPITHPTYLGTGGCKRCTLTTIGYNQAATVYKTCSYLICPNAYFKKIFCEIF